jgi:hypothetical protein
MNEDLLKAEQSAGFVVGDLQSSLARANAVEALILLELIASAAKLQSRIESLAAAVKESRGG